MKPRGPPRRKTPILPGDHRSLPFTPEAATRRTPETLVPRFGETSDSTIGVEEELQLVRPEDGRLTERPSELAETISDSGGRLQAEIFQAMLETTTVPCADVDRLAREMRDLRTWTHDAGREHGFAAVAAGTHPFATWETEHTTDAPRYKDLIGKIGLPMASDLVFGQHVHVGVGSKQEAIHVADELRTRVPLLLALSANSPFWRGLDTGLESARVNVSAGVPRSGLPPRLGTWDAFRSLIQAYESTGAIDDVTEVWWDVRPRPDLGTVEVRIADQPTRLVTSIALAALTAAFVLHAAQGFRRGEAPRQGPCRALLEENRWRAARHGVRARFIEAPPSGEARSVPFEDVWDRTIKDISPTIDRMGIRDQIQHLGDRVRSREGGADKQRAAYERGESLTSVVEDLAERTAP